jgi:hypothetical protein
LKSFALAIDWSMLVGSIVRILHLAAEHNAA